MTRHRKKHDRLAVQVAFRIKKADDGKKVTRKTLNALLELVVERKKLPKTVELLAVAWRNPDRPGRLSMWRYHEGAEINFVPQPHESTPRGSLREAIRTLFEERISPADIYFQVTGN